MVCACRFFSVFTDQKNKTTVDDVYAALALMYGYTASYAPSSVIEARIDALVVPFCLFTSNVVLPLLRWIILSCI